ncbi:hypothetical protein [Saliphagus sp. LR7]|nr:hypothetical protein [Saliphagus sp. LR7]
MNGGKRVGGELGEEDNQGEGEVGVEGAISLEKRQGEEDDRNEGG